MRKLPVTMFLFLMLTSLSAQGDWELQSTIQFPRLGLLSLDNQGFIFISDLEGNIYQYNKEGVQVNNFSPHRQGALTQLEAAWTVNIFTFSTDLQEYRILDRFINPVAQNRIPIDKITLAKVATLGNNNIIWVFDEADLSLKQFDYRISEILQNQPLNLILERSSLEVKDIREYQNLLFLYIKSEGVYILDNQGNYIRNLKLNLSQKLSFWKNYMVFQENDQLVLLNFQTGKREEFELPEKEMPKNVMINQYAIFFYDENKVLIYSKANSPLNNY
ncbi:hypothetical protein EF405_19360 [Cyclobacteriaceae bacterium YHN15]|nr:hypothetical protein EF405_19360 [Cyclobacteriaceae bacterium YHN15]